MTTSKTHTRTRDELRKPPEMRCLRVLFDGCTRMSPWLRPDQLAPGFPPLPR